MNAQAQPVSGELLPPETLTPIAEYTKTAVALATLRERYGKLVVDATTKDGMAQLIKARAEIRTYRLDLEKLRVEIKEEPLKRCRDIDSEAKRITSELASLEDPIHAQIKAEEARKQREMEEREAKEAKRVADIHEAIADVGAMPTSMVGKASAEIADAIERLRSHVIPAAEFQPVADEAKRKAIAMLEQLHAGAKAQEDAAILRQRLEAEEAERVARERAELERRRVEQDERDREEAARIAAETRRLAEERAKAEAEERARRAKIESDERASREKIEAEQRAARLRIEEEERAARDQRERHQAAISEIQGIQQQPIIAQMGRAGVRVGGTIACIEETLAETEAWPVEVDHFGALYASALEAKKAAVSAIRALLDSATAREAEAARLKAEREQQEAAERQARHAREAEDKRQQEERDRIDVERRELERKQNQVSDAKNMLIQFKTRFGDVAEFKPVVKAIDSYFDAAKVKADPKKPDAPADKP
jgi:hypothetical protein